MKTKILVDFQICISVPLNARYILQARKNWGRGGGELRGLLILLLWTEKKIVSKWKIVQNYKTSWNFSNFIDIYSIIIELSTRDGISCQ